ncbi:MAG: autotransporter-associated beta strand repeat-containing protein, partial [Candidatus Pacebacteria bacterium]|nr:autotransporter-associated beta strand repeat-containing protein [Candidatus Paceibacterota bacterium]
MSYRNISSSQWHTTNIPEGVALTISGAANDNLLVGNYIDPSDPDTNVAITGGGTLKFDNAEGYVLVRNGGDSPNQSHATLDLSGLNYFEAAAAGVRVSGDDDGDGAYRTGTLSLAESNRIDADAVWVGGYAEFGQNSYLYLGQSNDIYTGAFNVASSEGPGTRGGIGNVSFQEELDNPRVKIRGNSGEDSRANMYVATINNGAITNSYLRGYIDFTGGTVDAKLDNLRIGYDNQWSSLWSGGAPFSGSLSFDSGKVDVNTVVLGRSNGTVGPHGTITVGADGTLTVGSITLGQSNGNRAATGILNLNGTLEATSVVLGAGGSPAHATATLNFNGGTIRNKVDTDLTISSGTGSAVTFNLAGASATHTFEAQDGYSISVDSPVTGTGGFTKTGEGTLALSGDNGYTGNTTVNAGTLTLTHGTSSNTIADS